ncbi:universal stress protein UspA [Aeromonas salmonicida]|uniref:UspA domain protein n=1 Tax=Aeromonas salmonicida subsp. pectinolytica 34mel TaxID=1324960 RepID=T0P6V6_AERSA|nr:MULTISPECIES: universal stress protein [Aeromonas]ATP09442.1 UspA domain protein [Aeromonas salmonicida subsp. pectinolytica 34mel]EQC02710.1 UspA domain-containing protein [Aeromonas salmonicida subsp. pectinolytica 34mel]KTA76609.1 hypothetical protein VO69_21205 [Aeromonas salmonicida]MDE7529706.1 universal stress protein [Aeromonas salmonicida]MDE7533971.1 universal stress protein [Aeromonas salmonicida]
MKLFKRIAFVLSNHGQEAPEPALLRAVELAKTNQAELTLLKVIPSFSSFLAFSSDEQTLQRKFIEQEETMLAQLVASLDKNICIKTLLLTGKRYIETIHQVQIHGFDLVMKEPDQLDWLDRLFGSDDMHLLRKCPCPVWLVKRSDTTECKQILAAVAFDDDEQTHNDELNVAILEFASSLSLSDFATLHVLNSYETPEAGFISLWAENPEKVEKDMLESEHMTRTGKMRGLMDKLKARIGNDSFQFLSPRTYIIPGSPDREVPKMAAKLNIDLVVMGTVARTGIAGVIIGNTAESVLSQLNCSVFAIKPKGFVSPLSVPRN